MTPGWDAGLESWPTLEAFYEAVPPEVRRRSGESDFGCWWWEGRQGYSDQWRVSCVENTGEIYAVMMRGNLRGLAPREGSAPRVVLLGSLGPDPGYTKSHGCLVGWEDVCGGADSLEWAVNRVRLATGTISAVEAPLVSPPVAVSTARLRELYDAWQAETRVPGSAATDAFDVLEEVLYESLPSLLVDAGALDKIASALSQSPWPSGADFLDWTAEIVRDTGRAID